MEQNKVYDDPELDRIDKLGAKNLGSSEIYGLIQEIRRLRGRVTGLLIYNNELVERNRLLERTLSKNG